MNDTKSVTTTTTHAAPQIDVKRDDGGGDRDVGVAEMMLKPRLLLPRSPPVPIYLAQTAELAEHWSRRLLREVAEGRLLFVGLDTETTTTTPSRRPVSLLQIACPNAVFLFQLGRIAAARDRDGKQQQSSEQEGKTEEEFPSSSARLPPGVLKLLGAPQLVKVGCAIGLDNDRLAASYPPGLRVASTVDIQLLAHTLQLPQRSLGDLCERLLLVGEHGKKDALGHRGDWDAETLDDRQVMYAANDAYNSFLLYCRLMNIHPALLPTANGAGVLPLADKSELLEVDDVNALLQWLQGPTVLGQQTGTTETKARSIDSVVAQVTNSYGPWCNACMLRPTREKRAALAIRRLIDQGKLHWDEKTQTVSLLRVHLQDQQRRQQQQAEDAPVVQQSSRGLPNSASSSSFRVTPEQLANVKLFLHGLPNLPRERTRLVNLICNSYGPIVQLYTPADRVRFAQSVLDSLGFPPSSCMM